MGDRSSSYNDEFLLPSALKLARRGQSDAAGIGSWSSHQADNYDDSFLPVLYM